MRRLGSSALLVAVVALGACGGGRSPAPAAAPPTTAGPITTADPAATSAPLPATSSPSTSVAPATPTEPTGAAASPDELARQLVQAETSIRDPLIPVAELGSVGRAQQVAYRLLVLQPDWHVEVLEQVPADLRPIVEANLRAGVDLRALTPAPKPQPPDWEIVTPAPAGELLAEYKGAEAELGVGWEYLAAVHLVESRMGRIRGDSSAGAQGPMQFLPSTWRQYGAGGDINSNHDSIRAAARLLRANGAPDDMAAALYAYNHSQRYVRAITAYAGIMAGDERAYFAYHAWQVFYGDLLLPEGWKG